MSEEFKICEACLERKPLSEFYFRKENGRYRPACKKCKSVTSKEEINKRMQSGVKTCKICHEEKPVSEYHKTGTGRWLQPYCKECDRQRKRGWSDNNKDVLKQKKRAYYFDKVKPNIIRKGRVLVSEEHKKEKATAYRKRPEVKAKKAACDKRYRDENKEKVKANKKAYYDSVGLQMAKNWQKKNMNSLSFRTKKRLRGRIYVALKRGVKSESTMKLLGCTIDEFKKYFESLFTEGMSWDKYIEGGIHIDHKIPCKAFDLTDSNQQRECFHYTNLQPLWAVDNLKKGTSMPGNKTLQICQNP